MASSPANSSQLAVTWVSILASPRVLPSSMVAIMNPFKDFDDAVEKANRLPYGLAAYAFTQSSKRAMLISDALEAGMVAVNNVMIAGADAPFGGVKESGHGSEDGPEGVEACQVIKSVSMA